MSSCDPCTCAAPTWLDLVNLIVVSYERSESLFHTPTNRGWMMLCVALVAPSYTIGKASLAFSTIPML